MVQSGPSDAEAAYRALQSRLASLHSIKGELVTVKAGTPVRTVHFEIQKPNLYRVETQFSPSESLSIGDGKNDWYYTLPEKTYQKHEAQPDRTRIGALTGFEQFDSPGEIYYEFDGESQVTFQGEPATVIDMHFPASPNSLIKLYISKRTGWPLAFQLPEGKALDLTFEYRNLKPNAKIDPSEFRFNLPADAEPFAAPKFDLAAKLLKVGKPAPDFVLQDSKGTSIRLSNLVHSHKALLLDFWFRDCDPCRAELAHLRQNYAKLKKAGIEVLAVNCADSPGTVSRFLSQQHIAFPVVLDDFTHQPVNHVFGVQAFPTTYVIAHDGTIVARFVGFDESTLGDALRQIESTP